MDHRPSFFFIDRHMDVHPSAILFRRPRSSRGCPHQTSPPPRHPQRTPTKLLTSAPVSAFQSFTSLSSEPLTTRFPSGEMAIEFTVPEWPATGHPALTQGVKRRSSTADIKQMQLPSPECPIESTCRERLLY